MKHRAVSLLLTGMTPRRENRSAFKRAAWSVESSSRLFLINNSPQNGAGSTVNPTKGGLQVRESPGEDSLPVCSELDFCDGLVRTGDDQRSGAADGDC